jgi:uncharacterized membrane protein YfcA
LVAPLGAHAAHRFSVKNMRRVFSFFIVIVAVKMLYDLLHG